MVSGRLRSLLSRTAERPLLMGVLNVTPDSFSDGGLYTDADGWQRRVDRLLAEGADIVDIGGESTRPGAVAVAAGTQIERIAAPLVYAVSRGALVSVDTTLPEVAIAALALGAEIVNDVSCLLDPELARVAAHGSAALIIMHSRGSMAEMTGFSRHRADAYGDVLADVIQELSSARDRAIAAGCPREDLLFDPGLGFHKSADQSYALLRDLRRLDELGPLVVGASRKSFLQRDVHSPPAERLGGTIAACLIAFSRGARILRVHDVLAVRQAFAVAEASAGGGMDVGRGAFDV